MRRGSRGGCGRGRGEEAATTTSIAHRPFGRRYQPSRASSTKLLRCNKTFAEAAAAKVACGMFSKFLTATSLRSECRCNGVDDL